jgi:repressor LexA
VLGEIAAGIPIEAVTDIIDYEEIPEAMARDGEYFALKIKGGSMEPRMLEGDVVIVRKQSMVDTGDIAVVLVNGDSATVKKVKIMPEGIMLIPLNPAYETMFYPKEDVERLPVQILGKVVELRGKF